ncbi:MAG: hypothetical protein QHH10_08105 [Peptococcaceae bacterium]|jgi:hypothetical protein|nr:hypothetical protein [Peptococcaceae bacterium]MDH7525256.1 hypothetical protein [Peptococcaceae bacterium]
MKNGKRPTMRQKLLMKSRRLNPDNWFVTKDTPDFMEVVHRHGNTKRNIRKGGTKECQFTKIQAIK